MKPLRLAEARRAIRWFQDAMGLQDWTFTLFIQDEAPRWRTDESGSNHVDAGTQLWRFTKRANVWLCPCACASSGADMLQTLFHELLHISLEDAGLLTTDPAVEFAIDRLANAIAFAYRKGMKP